MIELKSGPKLEAAYKEKYGRDLIGKNMGQFHNDFDTINDQKEIPISIESYFITKKCYIHKLTDSTGDIGYQFRLKGITEEAVRNKADGNLMNLYKELYDGESIKFDLAKGRPTFKFTDNFTVTSLSNFIRTIKSNYDEGKSEEYFTY